MQHPGIEPLRPQTVIGSNLTSGGIDIPTTVPHPGRRNSRRAAPLFSNGAGAPGRTTTTPPWIRGAVLRVRKPGRFGVSYRGTEDVICAGPEGVAAW